MYVVVEIDKYGTLEIAIFESITDAQKLIEKLTFRGANKYKIFIRSPFKFKI